MGLDLLIRKGTVVDGSARQLLVLARVTSVVMGNCGFALAPCKAEERAWFAPCLTAGSNAAPRRYLVAD